MKRSLLLAECALVLAFAATGCAAHAVAGPPPIPMVPVSFEANLVTAQQCEYRGVAVSQEQARAAGANLVLAFTYADESSTQVTASNNVYGPQGGSAWTASEMQGKAVNCPKEAIDRILAMNRNGGAQ
jgi:hypothetical protein